GPATNKLAPRPTKSNSVAGARRHAVRGRCDRRVDSHPGAPVNTATRRRHKPVHRGPLMKVFSVVQGLRAAAPALVMLAIVACGGSHDKTPAKASDSTATASVPKGCDAGNGGITLPNGFCASVFADTLDHPRHLVVAPNGVVYVNTWHPRRGGEGGDNDSAWKGGAIVALQDTTGDGHADVIDGFGDSAKAGGHGGTGIALHGTYLYAEESDRIERYAMPSAGIVPTGKPEAIVSGMPLGGNHPMHAFAIDSSGAIFVEMGSAATSCPATGRSATPPSRAPSSRRKSCCTSSTGRISDGRTAISTARRRSSCSRPSTAATARKKACAPRSGRPSSSSRDTGRPMGSPSTRAHRSRRTIAAVRSSRSTVRGIARRCRRPGTSLRSSRSRVTRRAVRTKCSPTSSPARTSSPMQRRTGRLAWRLGPTVHCTLPTTRTAGCGA